MENENKIGRYKYNHLLTKSNLTDIEKKQIQEFESDRGLSEEQKKKVAEYFESIHEKPEQPPFAPVDLSYLYPYFLKKYKQLNGIEFLNDVNQGEPRLFAYTLLAYFFRSDKFLKSPLIVRNLNKPSLEKGLLVIGENGNGKSSTIKAIHSLIRDLISGDTKYIRDVNRAFQPANIYKPSFKYKSAKNLSREFSFQEEPLDKKEFWRVNTIGRLYIDDATKENKSSNFGFTDIVQELISEKYDKGTPLIMSINPVGDISATLEYLGQFYGEKRDKSKDGYIYDRFFQMFNIVELKGKSLRN